MSGFSYTPSSMHDTGQSWQKSLEGLEIVKDRLDQHLQRLCTGDGVWGNNQQVGVAIMDSWNKCKNDIQTQVIEPLGSMASGIVNAADNMVAQDQGIAKSFM